MPYQDAIYGAIEISDPVLIDLMNSAALQRLKGISQHGISGWLGITAPVTRFEHSVGVLWLTRHLGASLQEQIAALLHDVSHTVFSHVIDYAIELEAEASYHEVKKEQFIASSDLPPILAAHGYDWRDVLDEAAFSILEQPAPALCADRLDYFFRDGIGLGLVSETDVSRVLNHLIVYQGRIGMTDLAIGAWLAKTYMAMDQTSWAHLREVGLYSIMALVIRDALDGGFISEEDFWTTDAIFWEKLQQIHDDSLQQLLDLISTQTRFYYDREEADFSVDVKLRTIDPDIIMDGQSRRLSVLDEPFARVRDMYMELANDPWPIRMDGEKAVR
jgi:HD superfamily phosphohydrolase